MNIMLLLPLAPGTMDGGVSGDRCKAPFVSAYKRLGGGNKRESRQTLRLFPPILAYVVSRFRDLNYDKQKTRSEKIFA